MPRFPFFAFATLLCLSCLSCSSAEQEDQQARLEDFRERAAQYFNSGRYPQAFQQAQLGLRIEPDDGGLNLLAGRALVMQRDLQQVAHALAYLETAQEELDNYKADYSLAEFHFRYGSMLYKFAQSEKENLLHYPVEEPEVQKEKLALCEERIGKAENHFRQAQALLDDVLETVPENLDALEMRGQVLALLHQGEAALADLNQALDILGKSRKYKNRVLATDTNLSVEQEGRIRRDLEGDIQREVAIRFLIASIWKSEGDIRREEEQYTQILNLNPDMGVAYHSRGLCCYELGRLAEACADMREFVSRTDLEFDSPQVKQAMQIIEEFGALQSSNSKGNSSN